MKVKLFCLMLWPAVFFGQVGINKDNPQGTFDITAKNATGTSTDVDGILIPRVDRQRAQSMTGVQTSTMVYVNSIATGTQTGTAAHIDAVGYYYFNGTVWVKLESPAPDAFIPKMVAAGRTTATMNITGGTGFNSLNFASVGANDGNWNTANNTYTVATEGYYQFSFTASVRPSKAANHAGFLISVTGLAVYEIATLHNADPNFFVNRGGSIILYLAANSAVRFGLNGCNGCNTPAETYQVAPGSTFAITALGN
ncbi:hypothetical protein [Chryseobacterium phocaeense]|uniref:hypothetical protein n=1 Tax=Chryseobacterium phocaeense TaxID=1816690 RepID=UPI00111AD708|nr:hypothetical protein [Chryseobacterium phocaeense]